MHACAAQTGTRWCTACVLHCVRLSRAVCGVGMGWGWGAGAGCPGEEQHAAEHAFHHPLPWADPCQPFCRRLPACLHGYWELRAVYPLPCAVCRPLPPPLQALERVPNSVRLWRAAVELASSRPRTMHQCSCRTQWSAAHRCTSHRPAGPAVRSQGGALVQAGALTPHCDVLMCLRNVSRLAW